ncbi:MAG: helix-turn-helix domain-containing protein, partial [Clostridium sp.]|nr:helix-turn-helix domain-containing protein [Clostridium sp.]
MNQYITGAMIKRLREEKKISQARLAEALNVSDKAVSRWETGRGYP